jgi:hypothetical protein
MGNEKCQILVRFKVLAPFQPHEVNLKLANKNLLVDPEPEQILISDENSVSKSFGFRFVLE